MIANLLSSDMYCADSMFLAAGTERSEGAHEPKLVHREIFPTAVTAVAYLPDGTLVVALRSTNYLRLFEPQTLKVRHRASFFIASHQEQAIL